MRVCLLGHIDCPLRRKRRPGETMKAMSATNPPSDKAGSAAPSGTASETRSSAIMAAGTLVSRFLRSGKTWMLGAALGLGSAANCSHINANDHPNLTLRLVAGGASSRGPLPP